MFSSRCNRCKDNLITNLSSREQIWKFISFVPGFPCSSRYVFWLLALACDSINNKTTDSRLATVQSKKELSGVQYRITSEIVFPLLFLIVYSLVIDKHFHAFNSNFFSISTLLFQSFIWPFTLPLLLSVAWHTPPPLSLLCPFTLSLADRVASVLAGRWHKCGRTPTDARIAVSFSGIVLKKHG